MGLARPLSAAFAAVLVVALGGASAQATPLSASLSSSNGEGSFDPTLACPGGDGPSWRYAFSGVSTPLQGPFGGTWNSSIEVHDAGGRGGAYIPAGTGRIKVEVDRGGAANLEFAGGDCGSAALSLTEDADGDPVVSGSLPAQATGGSGAVRGFTGSGNVELSLELGAGADNVAQVDLAGDFDVRQPSLGLGSPTAYWRNLTDFLGRRLTVVVPVVNAPDPTVTGDAFAVRLTQATLSGRSPAGGIPASFGRINAGNGSAVHLTYGGASPNATYTLTGRVEGTDALDAPLAPVVQSRSVKAPLLP